MLTALEALERLREGNRRFVSGERQLDRRLSAKRRNALVLGQEPFAVILGCSDSRVPVELVFDHGLGDLFVIRVAGNIVAPSQIGSIEFAAARFGTRLVVVLGHTQCGAVAATIEELRRPEQNQSPNLRSIVSRIGPAVAGLLDSAAQDDDESLLRAAVRANVEASVRQLRTGSEILERLVREDGLLVVGAEYALQTGQVEFFSEEAPGG